MRRKRSTYEVRYQEVAQAFDANSASITVKVPKFLKDEWKRRKEQEGLKSLLPQIMRYSMHFALFGPHQFYNPVDGLLDAFESYGSAQKSGREAVIDVIKTVMEQNRVDIEDLR